MFHVELLVAEATVQQRFRPVGAGQQYLGARTEHGSQHLALMALQ